MSPGYDITLAVHSACVGVLGTVVNAFVLFLLISNKEIRNKSYMGFIINRTVADFLTCLVLAALQPLAILSIPMGTSNVCSVTGFLQMLAIFASLFTDPMLACNRYISIRHSHIYKRVYTKRNVLITCLLSWAIASSPSVTHLLIGGLGRIPGLVCVATITRATFMGTMISGVIPAALCVLVVGWFNFQVYMSIRRHQNTPINNQRSNLQNQRQLLRFVMAATFLPMLLESPAMVSSFATAMYPSAWSGWIECAAESIFLLSFITNPLLTLSMVQPVRNEAARVWRKLRGQHVATVHPAGSTGNQNRQ